MKDTFPTLLQSNLVYHYSCLGCKSRSYIGSTSRLLHVRICGHKGISCRTLDDLGKPEQSAIREHTIVCNGLKRKRGKIKDKINENNFKILAKAKNEFDLRILESLYIRKLRPSLNKDKSSFPLLLV